MAGGRGGWAPRARFIRARSLLWIDKGAHAEAERLRALLIENSHGGPSGRRGGVEGEGGRRASRLRDETHAEGSKEALVLGVDPVLLDPLPLHAHIAEP